MFLLARCSSLHRPPPPVNSPFARNRRSVPTSNRARRAPRRRETFMASQINVCLIGQKFMGRTHSNAFLKVGKFFDPPVLPVMHTIAGRNKAELEEFKTRWGWQNATTDWKEAIDNDDIGLVD